VTSRYATILGGPLSLLGPVFFLVMFCLGISLLTGRHKVVARE
jgi:uncharacterized membrane protein